MAKSLTRMDRIHTEWLAFRRSEYDWAFQNSRSRLRKTADLHTTPIYDLS